MADAVDGRRRDEREAATDADEEPAYRRIDLPVGPARHDIFEPTDLLALLVADRAPEDAGERHDGVEDAFLGQDAAGAAAALVRQAFGVTGAPVQQPGSARRVRRRWRGHGVPPVRLGRIDRIGQPARGAPGGGAYPGALSIINYPQDHRRARWAAETGNRPGSGQATAGRCAGGTTGGFAPSWPHLLRSRPRPGGMHQRPRRSYLGDSAGGPEPVVGALRHGRVPCLAWTSHTRPRQKSSGPRSPDG